MSDESVYAGRVDEAELRDLLDDAQKCEERPRDEFTDTDQGAEDTTGSPSPAEENDDGTAQKPMEDTNKAGDQEIGEAGTPNIQTFLDQLTEGTPSAPPPARRKKHYKDFASWQVRHAKYYHVFYSDLRKYRHIKCRYSSNFWRRMNEIVIVLIRKIARQLLLMRTHNMQVTINDKMLMCAFRLCFHNPQNSFL